MIYLLAGIIIVGLLWRSSRQRELFFLSVREERVLLVRGRIPQPLLNDFHDVVRRGGVRRGSIRVYRDEGGAALRTSGLDEGSEQRLRNILRVYPVSNLRVAPAEKERTLGQVLGIAWLAWVLDRGIRS
jgi:hypothetical protein